MNRRTFLTHTVWGSLVVATTGCMGDSTSDDGGGGDENGGGSGADDGDGTGGSQDWDTIETVTGGGDMVHALFVGELEEGDSITVEIVVERGTSTRFALVNRDNGDVSNEIRVYRSEQIDDYEPDQDAASPYRETITVPGFGEYEIRVTTPRDHDEVTVRFTTE